MSNKKLSLLLVAGSRDELRQYQVSYYFLIGTAAFIVLLFVANVFLTASFFKARADYNEIARLKAENEMLLAKYDEMRAEIREVNDIYTDLVDKEIVIRNIFNLPEISSDERQLGIGGPDGRDHELFSHAVGLAYSTEQNVDALVRLAGFEKEKYEEIYGILAEKKSLLDHTPSIMPCRGYMTRGYGMKQDPFTGYKRFHGGIDIANKTGTPVYATADGVVRYTGRMGDLGKLIEVDHGYNYRTRYGHLNTIKVKRGQKVRRGDLIGLMGSTGYSTGPHLHYEVLVKSKQSNPLKYILNN
ncbi:MAG: M23 family metallopeptidase [Candidatus Zixiibacteriota bacterium]|nr:MAG: M23 family metallopeptidase [candidate division Zixibacteria bacterium]